MSLRLPAFGRATTVLLALVALLATALPVAAAPPTSTPPGDPGTVVRDDGAGALPFLRYFGLDRFDTASLIAREGWDGDGADAVLLARSDEFPDSLAGAYVAGLVDAPLLLTGPDALDDQVLPTMDELGADTAYVLGGANAVSADVVASLEASGVETVRLGGSDRYETAALIATSTGPSTVGQLDGQRTALLSTGLEFADALAAGGIAGGADLPLLLTGSTLPDATAQALQDLDIEQVLVLGGTNAVPATVESTLVAAGYDVERVAGDTRVGTAIALADLSVDRLGFDPATITLAQGRSFPDALSVGPRAARDTSPILLSASATSLDETGRDDLDAALADFGCAPQLLRVAGGTAAVSAAVAQRVRDGLTTDGACGLTLDASDDTATTDETVTVTASVTDQFGDPLGDVDVDFATDDDATLSDATATDGVGTATVEVTADQPGDVTVTASVTDDAAADDLTADVTITFEEPVVDPTDPPTDPTDPPTEPTDPPTDPAVPTTITLAPATATADVDEDTTFTATVLDQDGMPFEGDEVTFTATSDDGADPTPTTGTDTTDASGEATFTVAGGDAGTITVAAESATAGTDTATLTVEPVLTLTLTPETATTELDEDATFTATVTDQDGAPVDGLTVAFTADGGDGVTVDPTTGTDTTDTNGEATFTVSADAVGDVTVTATATAPDASDASTLTDTSTLTVEIAPIVVDDDGTDAEDCGTEASPCASIEVGSDRAVETGADTVLVQPGTYDDAPAGPQPQAVLEDGVITLDQGLMVLGPNAGVPGDSEERTEEAVITSPVRIDGDEPTTFSGFHRLDTSGAAVDGIFVASHAGHVISDTIIERDVEDGTGVTGARGIELVASPEDGALTIATNLITSPAGDEYDDDSWRSGIYSNGGQGDTAIQDNVFTGNRAALNLDDDSASLYPLLTGNTFGANGTDISIGGSTMPSGEFAISGNDFEADNEITCCLLNLTGVSEDFVIDVTDNTFDGTPTDELTTDELFNIESRMYHKGRSGRNGFVRVVEGQVFQTPASGPLQDAIDAAQDELARGIAPVELVIAPGTHAGPSTITSGITLRGVADDGGAPPTIMGAIEVAAADEDTVTLQDLALTDSTEVNSEDTLLSPESGDVVVDGVDFTPGTAATGTPNGITTTNAYAGTVTVTDATFSDFRVGVSVNNGTVTVADSTLTDNVVGVTFADPDPDSGVSGSTVSGHDRGIEVFGDGPTVTDVTFEDNTTHLRSPVLDLPAIVEGTDPDNTGNTFDRAVYGEFDRVFGESIQDGVDAAGGSTVFVRDDGSDDPFTEVVDVTEATTVVGTGDPLPTLEGSFGVGADLAVTGMAITDLGVPQGGEESAFYVDAPADLVVTDVDVTGDGDGRGVVNAFNTTATVAVQDSSFTDLATGVFFNPGLSGTVAGSTFTGNVAGVGTDSAGGILITDNDFSGNTSEGVGIGAVDVVVEGNRFDGTNAAAINSYVDVETDAEANWYGDASGPDHPGNPGGTGDEIRDDDQIIGGVGDGDVDYDPFCTVEGCSELLASEGSLEDAIDAAGSVGGTLTIAPGTYTEDDGVTTVDDDVTVVGQDGVEVVGSFELDGATVSISDVAVSAPVSVTGSVAGFYVAGGDVTLTGVSVDGTGGGTNPSGVLTAGNTGATVSVVDGGFTNLQLGAYANPGTTLDVTGGAFSDNVVGIGLDTETASVDGATITGSDTGLEVYRVGPTAMNISFADNQVHVFSPVLDLVALVEDAGLGHTFDRAVYGPGADVVHGSSIEAVVAEAEDGDEVRVVDAGSDQPFTEPDGIVSVMQDVDVVGLVEGRPTVEGSFSFSDVTAGLSGLDLSDVQDVAGTLAAIYVAGGDLTVTDVTVTGDGATDGIADRGIVNATGQPTMLTVQGSTFTDLLSGITTNPGVQLDVSGSSFEDNVAGIGTDSPDGIDIQDNDFTGNVEGVGIGADGVSITNNRFVGNTEAAIRSYVNVNTEAFPNWYGDAAGPTHSESAGNGDAIIDLENPDATTGLGNIDYTPFCTVEDCSATSG